jgi:hypothetical protein
MDSVGYSSRIASNAPHDAAAAAQAPEAPPPTRLPEELHLQVKATSRFKWHQHLQFFDEGIPHDHPESNANLASLCARLALPEVVVWIVNCTDAEAVEFIYASNDFQTFAEAVPKFERPIDVSLSALLGQPLDAMADVLRQAPQGFGELTLMFPATLDGDLGAFRDIRAERLIILGGRAGDEEDRRAGMTRRMARILPLFDAACRAQEVHLKLEECTSGELRRLGKAAHLALTGLNIEEHSVDDESLVDFLRCHPSLTHLDVMGAGHGEGFLEFLGSAGCTLRTLTIDCSKESLGALRTNTSLRELRLWQAAPSHAPELCAVIRQHEGLEVLRLWRDTLGEEGVDELIEALRANTSLTDVSVGTCNSRQFNEIDELMTRNALLRKQALLIAGAGGGLFMSAHMSTHARLPWELGAKVATHLTDHPRTTTADVKQAGQLLFVSKAAYEGGMFEKYKSRIGELLADPAEPPLVECLRKVLDSVSGERLVGLLKDQYVRAVKAGALTQQDAEARQQRLDVACIKAAMLNRLDKPDDAALIAYLGQGDASEQMAAAVQGATAMLQGDAGKIGRLQTAWNGRLPARQQQ